MAAGIMDYGLKSAPFIPQIKSININWIFNDALVNTPQNVIPVYSHASLYEKLS